MVSPFQAKYAASQDGAPGPAVVYGGDGASDVRSYEGSLNTAATAEDEARMISRVGFTRLLMDGKLLGLTLDDVNKVRPAAATRHRRHPQGRLPAPTHTPT